VSDSSSGGPFGSEELLREALEEVADAPEGSCVEEPWGSSALAAAAEVAAQSPTGALRDAARRAVERVAESSELRDLDAGAVERAADDLRSRLA
jgi:hypothetical protein